MDDHKFSKKEAIRFGWQTMKDNLVFFIKLILVVMFIGFATNLIGESIEEKTFLSFAFALFSLTIQLIIDLGIIKIALKMVDGTKAGLEDLFSNANLLFGYFLAWLIYALMVLGGLILFIVPGIIWAIKFQFYPYFIIEKKLDPVEALKKSAFITKGAKWDLFVFGLLLVVINILGLLALVVGLFAAVPTTIVAHAFVYRKLLSRIEGQAQLTI